MYNALVTINWEILEKQPLYVKSTRKESEKHGYRIELAVDRKSDNDLLRGESFFVYGRDIENLAENTDVEIKINEDKSRFIKQDFGYSNFIVVKSVKKKFSEEDIEDFKMGMEAKF